MRNTIILLFSLFLVSVSAFSQTEKPDAIWFKYDNRFIENSSVQLAGIDSVEFTSSMMKMWRTYESGNVGSVPQMYNRGAGVYMLTNPGRHLSKPSSYSSVNYEDANSQWCFERSMESEHFVCFWEKGLNKVGYTVSGVNINTLLQNAEKIWDMYVNKLGFLIPGKSITDDTKIHMYIVNQSDWRADGSGSDGTDYYYSGFTKNSRSKKVGLFHCNPDAATARGGHTPAHEIGHVFQYLVSADLGMTHGLNYGFGDGASGGNCWWEDCANWQAYKVYPERQFTDGEYLEQNMDKCHLNILHEDARYTNCFYQDYWCMKHGMDAVGRVWRESTKPEDPMEAFMRIYNLSVSDFADEMYDCFARQTSWEIDGVRDLAKSKIGIDRQRLIEPSAALRDKYLDGDKEWWIVSSDYCVQNYGHNSNPLKIPAAGTKVTATFRGLAGADGYRKIKTDKAGWRYGLVAYTTTGKRVYSEMQSAKEGVAELVVPENCCNMWFVVMGAPTEYWRHPWDDNSSNDEQWPYAVRFSGTDPLGASHTYDSFPEDYVRKDTTVVINATLARSTSQYSSVRVQYDMDAIAQALGITTAQMKAIKRNDTTSNPGDVRFAGVNVNTAVLSFNTTTSTSSATCYGHWFNAVGNVCNYDSSAYIFAEMYPESYGCYVGQYPGRLTVGKTYIIRQAIVYTHTDGKVYKAIMEVHLKVV